MEQKNPVEKFFEEAFPAVSAETRVRVRSFFAKAQPDHKWMFAASVSPEPIQGDIVTALPAFFFDGERVRTTKTPCPIMMLEHECDMVTREGSLSGTYVFAPLFPYKEITKRLPDSSAIDSNIITTKLLMRGIPVLDDDYVADFDMIGSISAQAFHDSLQQGRMRRVASLSRDGFYFFLAKLSAHFLRGTRERWSGESAGATRAGG